MILFLTQVNPFSTMIKPIVDLLNMVIAPALLLVGSIGSIYCILLGVKLAKADEPQERDKAKHALKNAIVGFLLIFILIAALRVGMPAMTNWVNSVAIK